MGMVEVQTMNQKGISGPIYVAYKYLLNSKVFLWCLAKHSIPTLDILNHGNMSTLRIDCCLVCAIHGSTHSLIALWPALANEDMLNIQL
mgnify:CR=1 FL=1